MIPIRPPSVVMLRSFGAAHQDEYEEPGPMGPLGWFVFLYIPVFILAFFSALALAVFGEARLVVSESILVRVVSVRTGKNACVSFVALPSQHLHDCERTRKGYHVGSHYEITREIWQDKQSRYYEFPGL